MITFENKVYEGIYYSRFVSSWINAKGGKCDWRFYKWLTTLVINDNHIPDDICKEIWAYGTNGKLELEENARRFLRDETDTYRLKLRELEKATQDFEERLEKIKEKNNG